MTYGERITMLALDKNLTAAEIAERLRVGEDTVNRWMTDKSLPSLRKMNALAGVFGVDIAAVAGDNYDERAVAAYKAFKRLMAAFAAVSFLPVIGYIISCVVGLNLYRQSILPEGPLTGRPDLDIDEIALPVVIAAMSVMLVVVTVGYFLCLSRQKNAFLRYRYYRVFWLALSFVMLNCCFIPSYANFFGFALIHPMYVVCAYAFAFVGATVIMALIDGIVLAVRGMLFVKSGKIALDFAYAALGAVGMTIFFLTCTVGVHAMEWIMLTLPFAELVLAPAAILYWIWRLLIE